MEDTNTQRVEKKENMNYNNKAVSKHYDYFSPFRPLFGFFDDDYFENRSYNKEVMRTDIEDDGNNYLLKIEVPGIKKEDIKISLEEGYLSIGYKLKNEVKEGSGKRIHTERTEGFYRRDFFVGYDTRKEDIKASMDNGILSVIVPKNSKKADTDKYITIE